jgi:hypothetical protein
MKVGDVVNVRLPSDSPNIRNRVGIIIKEEYKMYMVGNIFDVMIDGVIKRVKAEHIEKINESR